MTVTIEAATPQSPDALILIRALDADLAGPYRADQHHGLTPEALEESNIRFFLARIDGAAVGCGAVELFEDFAEVKRMYTAPTARGAGVGRALLARIEAEAVAAGAAFLRLETGIYQDDAIRLYERAGFVECGVFGRYAEMPPITIESSAFYEKALTVDNPEEN